MPDVDIEILDAPPDATEHNYPMAIELEVEGRTIKKGDLLFSPETEHSDQSWTEVTGFDWGGLYTNSLTHFRMTQFREWEDIMDNVENGGFQIDRRREQTSYFLDDNQVRTLSHYRHFHDDGFQIILVSQTRHPLETTHELQFIQVYDDTAGLIDDIYTPEAVSDLNEAKAIYEFLLNSGVRETVLPTPEEVSSQSELDSFES